MNLTRLLVRLILGRRLPAASGSLLVDGLDGEILIRRDRWGIPYIEGSSERDVWTGLGFCHAQDRAFQLETIRRLASGTLAEVVGRRGLPVDRLVRRLGFVRYARMQFDSLDQQERRTLEAYSSGISLGLDIGRGSRAHEFLLTGSGPSSWEAIDVLACAKLLAFAMSANWDAELARFRVLTEDGHEALTAVDPEYAAWHPVTASAVAPAGEQIDRLSTDMAALIDALGISAGSNAWVVGPTRSATGRPILANDPHLPPRLPAAWYLAHLDSGDWRMAGATFVGMPIVAVGHNGSVAWGITLGLADTSDLYIESAREAKGKAHVVGTVREEIKIRGRASISEEIYVTPRGPQICPPIDGSGYALSIRAAWMEPKPIHGLMRVHRARDCEELRQAFAAWPLMSMNVVFADAEGSIGWQLAGDVPVRASGHGILPSAAWTGEGAWEPGTVPFREMPGASNPETGYLVSANHRPLPEGVGPFLGVDWADGLRATRIGERLASSSSWDVAGIARLQMDQLSVQWREVREQLLKIRPLTPESERALSLLAEWDGLVSRDSAPAAVFELLMARIDRLDVEELAPRAGHLMLGADVARLGVPNLLAFRRAGRLTRILRERDGTRAHIRWQTLLSEALAQAASELSEAGGPEPVGWQWGRVRSLVLEHPMGRIRPLDRVFNVGPFDYGGDTNTVSQAAVNPLEPLANPLVIASLRSVVDVGDFGRSRFALAGGQSGNPFSPHYADMVPLWIKGEGVTIAWTRQEIDQAAASILRLRPPSGRSASNGSPARSHTGPNL